MASDKLLKVTKNLARYCKRHGSKNCYCMYFIVIFGTIYNMIIYALFNLLLIQRLLEKPHTND